VTEPVQRGTAALEALRSSSGPRHPSVTPGTTSGLSIDEQLAIAQVGYEAVDIVSGAAVVRLGTNAKSSLHPFRTYEVERLSGLLTDARELAVRQMEERCTEIHAAGVIGVRLDFLGAEQDGLATYVASGTAIRPIAGAVEATAATFTSSLSGQDFHLLHRAKYVPVGLVVGTSIYHVGWRTLSQWTGALGRCLALTRITESLYAARESAIESLHSNAKLLAADGVIDVKVVERANVWTSHVIEFVAYGTAIKGTQAQRQPIDPQIVVLLNDVQSPASQVQGASTLR
jgi:uncharacterized protein YbjQ (UPF0145 family)